MAAGIELRRRYIENMRPALFGGDEVEQYLDERRLAGAVDADEPENFARHQRESDFFQDFLATVSFVHIFHA